MLGIIENSLVKSQNNQYLVSKDIDISLGNPSLQESQQPEQQAQILQTQTFGVPGSSKT